MTLFNMWYKLRFSDGTIRRYEREMGDFDNTGGTAFADAVSAVTQIATSYQPLTNAVLAGYGLVHVIAENGLLPAAVDGVAEAGDEATVVVFLADTPEGEEDKTWNLVIKAPELALFQATSGRGYNIIDIQNADLEQHVQQLAQHALVSDGETIDTAKGPYASGISHGFRSRTGGKKVRF